MKIETSRFGAQEVEQQTILHFPNGLLTHNKTANHSQLKGFKLFHGKKQNRLVAVGPINLPVTRLYVEELLIESLEKNINSGMQLLMLDTLLH